MHSLSLLQLLPDLRPSAHHLEASTQETRADRKEIRFIQGLALGKWRKLSCSKFHLGELRDIGRLWQGREGGMVFIISRACVHCLHPSSLVLEHHTWPWSPEDSYKHIACCNLNSTTIYILCVSWGTELENKEEHSDVIWRFPDVLSFVNSKSL